MCCKTVLVHVNSAADLDARLEFAFGIAQDHSAHVIGAAVSGISRMIFHGGDGTDVGTAECMNAMLDIARKQAVASLGRFEARAKERGLSHEIRLVEGEPYSSLTFLAQSCDLVVVSRGDRNDPASDSLAGLPEYIALGSGRPVMLFPACGTVSTPGRRVLIGWNASISAVHALAAAQPFLKQASSVTIAVFNAEAEQHASPDPSCSDLQRALARQGIEAEMLVRHTKNDIGSALLDAAKERGADLLVMGCYGHTRFREILLGGATRTILEDTKIPVLMAH